MKKCITDVLLSKYSRLSRAFDNDMKKAAEMMLEAGIITQTNESKPNFDAIINNFLSALDFMDKLEDIKEHCVKFLSVFYTLGGPFVHAGNMIKKHICKKASDELGLKLNLKGLC